MNPADHVDWDPDPMSPRNIWANACTHAVAAAYGVENAKQWHAHPHYKRLARRLADLFGRGIPITDLQGIVRGEIPWPF
jgi:hypothetical protein